MVGIKNNRRVLMTRRLIQDSLLQLLQKQPLAEITVTAVCKAANINRGTFYAHYQDVDDCLKKIEDELSTELLETINQNLKPNSLQVLLASLFRIVQDHHDAVYFMINNDMEFLTKFVTVTREEISNLHGDRELTNSPEEEAYAFEYYIYGVIGAVKLWLRNDMRESPEQLAEYLQNWTYRGMRPGDLSKK